MKRRQNFLLLELLIAFTLVSLCALPLLRTPLAHVHSQIISLEKMELERLAELSYTAILSDLLLQNIPWEALDKGKKSSLPDATSKVHVHLNGLSERTFEQKTFYWTLQNKEGVEGEEHRLIAIQIEFLPSRPAKKQKPLCFYHEVFLTKN